MIRTTVPPRTMGSSRKMDTPNAVLMRMSFIELERQRRIKELEMLKVRSIKLTTRLEEIGREQDALKKKLDTLLEPLASAEVVGVSRPGSSASSASSAAAARQANAHARGSFAIRY